MSSQANWHIESNDGVAEISYLGAQRSLSLAAVGELADALENLSTSMSSVSVVLLTSAGEQCIPDADHDELDRTKEPEPIVGDVLAWHRVTSALGSLPQPTVMAIDGPAAGGGCLIALACTFRIASDRSVLGPVRFNMGIVGTDSCSHLVRLVGPAVSADLLLTGRELSALEAKQVGLINQVVRAAEFSDRVQEWCNRITKNPPWLILEIKKAVDGKADSSWGQGWNLDSMALQEESAYFRLGGYQK